MAVHQLVQEVTRLDAELFFDQVLPKLGVGAPIPARVKIEVGERLATVDLSRDEAPAEGDQGVVPDLLLRFAPDDFAAVLSGKADAGIEARCLLELHGDPRSLQELCNRLRASGDTDRAMSARPFTTPRMKRTAGPLRGISGAFVKASPPRERPINDTVDSGATVPTVTAAPPGAATDPAGFAARNLATWLTRAGTRLTAGESRTR